MLFNRTRADTLLGREGIEAVVATSRENVEYITGHQNPTHAHESVDDFRGVFASDSASRERRYSDSRSRNVHGQSLLPDLHLFGFFARSAGEDAMVEIGRAGRALMTTAHNHQNAVDGLVAALRSPRRFLSG
jgi:hypothetical protein